MGYMRHHAIVVTSWKEEAIEEARRAAACIFDAVTPLTDASTNGYRSFLISPDGSKEGWDESGEGDRRRETFKAYLRATVDEDGSGPLDWCEIQYGDDSLVTRIIDDSDADQRKRDEAQA